VPRRTSPIASLRQAFAAASAPLPVNVLRSFFWSRALQTQASTLSPRWRIPVGFLVIEQPSPSRLFQPARGRADRDVMLLAELLHRSRRALGDKRFVAGGDDPVEPVAQAASGDVPEDVGCGPKVRLALLGRPLRAALAVPLPPPGDDRWPLADALARVVAAREALDDGEIIYAAAILERVELDLAAWMQRLTEAAA
jgi:hypothetical protein